ncbi:MAG: tRNA (adenosine(37)-N6)-dimethylallyltransferase MiaA [Bacteroidales bacterium]|nr:tRNA (adenosine(37)-N6)-dimethylallyltransferase MiaA [Bacteroidales bacterium]MDD4215874.1 tRNA (adenosine(37)-N6)-dimethylallyltransferase MiaA [Bacteroidales bacterium]MDY0140672.1 tRNA (adenosine(37)-N6)-dimethylallyltransferase MiaA [Bacteroidales bacterium]
MNKNKHLVIVFGPTGVGKTDVSIQLALYFGAEIFSYDSRQFYKELGIGVAKPDANQLSKVKHHFINNVSIHDHYSISQFETEAISALDEYFKTNDIAIMVGGSGLYVDAICKGVDIMPDHDEKIRQEVIEFYENNGIEALRFELKKIDPEYYKIVDLKNPQRLLRAIEIYRATGKPFSQFRTNKTANRNFNIIKLGIDLDREILYNRINDRVDNMIKNGLIKEANHLHKYRGLVALKTIGYTEFFNYFETGNEQNLEKTVQLLKRNTRHYARRQLTWFRRYKDAKWFGPKDLEEIKEYVNLKVK